MELDAAESRSRTQSSIFSTALSVKKWNHLNSGFIASVLWSEKWGLSNIMVEDFHV